MNKQQSKRLQWGGLQVAILAAWYRLRMRQQQFLARRPHRSFRLTERRDYIRSLQLPGYWAFTLSVLQTLWRQRATYLWVVLIYAVLTGVFVGIASQEVYTTLRSTLGEASQELFAGDISQLGEAGLLLLAGMSGSFNETLSELQQFYTIAFGLLAWLTTVWLLRAQLAGRRVRFRDALYSSGAPIVATFLLVVVLIIQLLPVAVAAIATSAAIGSGFLENGAVAMIFTVTGVLLVALSLYWVTSTMIALVVVTLPGVYPMQAIKAAGDLVTGRRLRILYRWLWLIVMIILLWVCVVIPFILLDAGVKSIAPFLVSFPLVPLVLLVVSSCTVVFSSAYVYLLYRKVVDDDALPA